MGWPRGRSPVIVTSQRILDCLDERCERANTTTLGFTAPLPYGATAIGVDGAIYVVSTQGLEMCDALRLCERSGEIIRKLGYAQAYAIALSPYGGILIADARNVPDPQRPNGLVTEIRLIRCRNVYCADPQVTVLGRTNEGSFKDNDGRLNGHVLALGIADDTRPIVALYPPSGGPLWFGWCAPITCTDPGVGIEGRSAAGMPTAQQLAAMHFAELFYGLRQFGRGQIIARPEGGYYRVSLESGNRPERQRLILLSCQDADCNGAQRTTVAEVPRSSADYPGDWLLAADPDGGRVVLAPANAFSRKIFVVKF